MALTPEQQAMDFNPELQDVSRQRKLAELLMSQGLEQPQGQMISGHYVAPSWAQQLNPMAKIVAGQAIGERSDTKQAQMAEMLRVKGDAAAQDVMQTYQQNPQAALAKATQLQQYPQVKALLPQLAKTAISEPPTSMQEFQGAQQNPAYAEFLQQSQRNKGTNISVNTGQHGFDNALKLRTDFRAEPIYKGFEETKAAKLQIDQAAKMASPAGDLAAATKVMKILDPGSVVRESELGMAMAATGVEDKVKNYANLVITGQKLTPAQRKDFVDLSDKLYNAAAGQFNQKRNEYVGIAERNKLDVEAAVGAPADIKAKQLTPQDQQALQWANSNPSDPRATQIKKKLGIQ
jgi:hypothetical protein